MNNDDLDQYKGIWVRPGRADRMVVGEMRDYADLPFGGARVLDIGGHIGCFAALAAEKEATAIVTVEPHPDNFRVLRYNIDYAVTTPIQAAVADRAGHMQLFMLDTPGAMYQHSLVPYKGRTASITVPTVTLPSLLAEHQSTLIKIDIEGGEWFLLPELEHLPDHVECLAMELHVSRRVWRDSYVPRLLLSMEAQGFRAVVKPDFRPGDRGRVFMWRR